MEINHITQKLEQLGLEVVIGIETHIRLNTATKLFCGCANEETELPNHNICPVCTGQMGVLPAINREAVRKAICFGKAVQSGMGNQIICWDRKQWSLNRSISRKMRQSWCTRPMPHWSISTKRAFR